MPVIAPLFEGIGLTHLGYLAEVFAAKDKRARNLHLATLDLVEATTTRARCEAEMNLGRSYLLAGDSYAALAHLDLAAESEVGIVARYALHTAVLTSLGMGDFALAENYLDRLRRRCVKSALPDLLAGTIACRRGDYEEALQWLGPLRTPLLDDDHVPRGGGEIAPLEALCHRGLGNFAIAGDIALAEISAHGRYREPLGLVMGDLSRSHRDLADLGRVLPSDHLKLWLAQLIQADPDQALRVLDGVLQSHPGEMAVLAAGGSIARRSSVSEALRWSVILAGYGIEDRPLLGIVGDEGRSLTDRVLAAATAIGAFGDRKARDMLTGLLASASTEEAGSLGALIAPILPDASSTACALEPALPR